MGCYGQALGLTQSPRYPPASSMEPRRIRQKLEDCTKKLTVELIESLGQFRQSLTSAVRRAVSDIYVGSSPTTSKTPGKGIRPVFCMRFLGNVVLHVVNSFNILSIFIRSHSNRYKGASPP